MTIITSTKTSTWRFTPNPDGTGSSSEMVLKTSTSFRGDKGGYVRHRAGEATAGHGDVGIVENTIATASTIDGMGMRSGLGANAGPEHERRHDATGASKSLDVQDDIDIDFDTDKYRRAIAAFGPGDGPTASGGLRSLVTTGVRKGGGAKSTSVDATTASVEKLDSVVVDSKWSIMPRRTCDINYIEAIDGSSDPSDGGDERHAGGDTTRAASAVRNLHGGPEHLELEVRANGGRAMVNIDGNPIVGESLPDDGKSRRKHIWHSSSASTAQPLIARRQS